MEVVFMLKYSDKDQKDFLKITSCLLNNLKY